MLSNTRLNGQIWKQTKEYLIREKGLYSKSCDIWQVFKVKNEFCVFHQVDIKLLNTFSLSYIAEFSQLEPILFIEQLWENFTFDLQ